MTVATNSASPETSQELSPSLVEGFMRKDEAEYYKYLATWVKEKYDSCKRTRTEVENVWYRNMSFYLGNQWVVARTPNEGIITTAAAGGRLYVPKAPPWRVRHTINRIKPIIRTELSRVTSQDPSASAVPASSEDEDLFAAHAAEQVWESWRSRKLAKTKFRRAMFWTLLCGTGFTKQWWDPNAFDKDGQTQGDIQYEPVSPFHLFVPDLAEEELEGQSYIIHAFVRNLEWARLNYPQLFEGNPPKMPPLVSATEIMNNAYLKINTNNREDSVLCLEMWIKPGTHRDFPQGGMLQLVGDTLVHALGCVKFGAPPGMPYQHNEYPFTKYDHIPTGKFYADSVIVDLIDPQMEYNRTRSQITEAKNRMAKPQLMAPRGSVDPKRITTEPGIVIEYMPGFDPPQPMPLQSIPPYVIEELNRILADMEDISAQHEVSKGNVPPGVTAATAISYLQERDDSVLSSTYDSVEEGQEKTARQVVALVQQFYDIERTIKVTGTDGYFDSLALKGSQITAGTDIRMEGGSALPISKAAKQAFLMDLMSQGFIPPDQGLRLMEIGGVEKLYAQLKIDERQAQRENLRMKLTPVEQILQYEQQRNALNFQQGQAMMGSDIVPPELADVITPDQMNPETPAEDTGEGGMMPQQGNLPTQPQGPMDIQTGQPLNLPPLVPVNTWDNHMVHIEVHNRFRKSQAFDLLAQPIKDLFEEHVQLHAMALNQSANNAMMAGMPGMDQGMGQLDQGGQTNPQPGGQQQAPPPPGSGVNPNG